MLHASQVSAQRISWHGRSAVYPKQAAQARRSLMCAASPPEGVLASPNVPPMR